jgi:hypothetical protein
VLRLLFLSRLFVVVLLSACATAAAPGGVALPAAAERIELAPSAQRVPALYLDVWVAVHGTSIGPLYPDMTLHSGDRIGLQARTSSAAEVYVIHCDGAQTLSLIGPVNFLADQRVPLPAAGIDLRLQGLPGDEAVYVIASRRPLGDAAPRMAAMLAGAAAAPELARCGAALDQELADSPATPARALRLGRRSLRGAELSHDDLAAVHACSEDDGVVVLRFGFRHAP